MLLHDLLRRYDPGIPVTTWANAEITGVQDDSRRVRPGSLFIARAGTKTDGRVFMADAQSRGAAAVVTQAVQPDVSIPQIVVPDAGAAGAAMSHLFHGNPTEKVRVLAVTGTNGKTTTTYIIRHLLQKVGTRCGLIGTVQIDDGRKAVEAENTTPGACELAEVFGRMRDNGCWTCAMEASSHALHQERLAGIRLAGAAFTNLTGDHLDYHKTMPQYAAAKARLFQALPDEAVAVVNGQDKYSAHMIRGCRARVMRFGFTRRCDYWARDIAITSIGSSFVLVTPDGEAVVHMDLIGRHNIENALTAAALVGEAFQLTVHQIAAGLRDAQGAPGRLQAVRFGQPFAVLVDYAHTDDALENVLSALRPLTRGKLRVLFGCGGDRDRTKRPRMARTAEKLADVVYVTSDNPRTENAGAIIAGILTGFGEGSGKPVVVEADRRKAIEKVLGDAQAGDVVLLAGKGHEDYQIIGTEKRHFDDVEEAERCLRRLVPQK